jgi:hypothetical protein
MGKNEFKNPKRQCHERIHRMLDIHHPPFIHHGSLSNITVINMPARNPINPSGKMPLLPPERASFGQPRLTTGRLAQHLRAAGALYDGLGVREDGRDCEAAGALYVHEEGAWAGYEGLELVLARFGRGCWVEEVDGENLFRMWISFLSLLMDMGGCLLSCAVSRWRS